VVVQFGGADLPALSGQVGWPGLDPRVPPGGRRWP